MVLVLQTNQEIVIVSFLRFKHYRPNSNSDRHSPDVPQAGSCSHQLM